MEQKQIDKFLLMSFILNFCLTFCLIYLVSVLFFLGLVGKNNSSQIQPCYEAPFMSEPVDFPGNEE